MGLRAGLDWCGKSRPTGIRSPDRPARRKSTSVEVPAQNLQDYSYTRQVLLNRFTKLIPVHIFNDSFQQHNVEDLSLAAEVNVQLLKPREVPFSLAKRSVTECLQHNKSQSF